MKDIYLIKSTEKYLLLLQLASSMTPMKQFSPNSYFIAVEY